MINNQRMAQLYTILSNQTDWVLISSSNGGLMGTVFTLDHATQVLKLILLVPALTLPPLASKTDLRPVSVSTTLIHGTADNVVPLKPVRDIAQNLFTNLTYYHIAEDDYRLYKFVNELDWNVILS